MLLVRFATLVRMTTQQFLRNNCAHMAAAIAYYSLFSLFPLALAIVSILGFFYLDSPEDRARFAEGVAGVLPVAQGLIASSLEGVVRARGATGVLAIVGLLWAGSTVFAVIRKAVNYSFGVTVPMSFLKERLMDFGLMAAAGLALLASVAFTASFEGLRRAGIEAALPVLSSDYFWRWGIQVLFPWALSSLTFLALYRYLPNSKVGWRYLAFGALVGSVGFEGTKHVFVWYLESTSTYAQVYGSLGTVVAFLTWGYASAFTLLVGGEVASVLPKVVGPQALPSHEERAIRALQDLYKRRSPKKGIRARAGAASPTSAQGEGDSLSEGEVLLALAPAAPPTVREIVANLVREWVTEAAERAPKST
ncbi:MAG: YihY/virulence factor BrkB family protein [Dehalococcoidia bacterium]|nr:YihY/virulence factor BrkB family protein [Dehalococcoidia bacterium]